MNSLAINTTLNDRISAFAKAGSLLNSFLKQEPTTATAAIEAAFYKAQSKNSWFTDENLNHAFEQWALALTVETLTSWTNAYNLEDINSKVVAIITAGNLPLVGFHDVLSVIITGHHAMIINSSNDDVLTPMLLQLATDYLPELSQSYSYNDGRLTGYDAVIATGSDNTARYFEYYFDSKPHIIRKNRNSIAVLTGTETIEHMEALSKDVFNYFGLGCRSVSHLMVPRNYNFDLFFNGMFKQQHLIKNEKYVNNYDYNKAVYLMSEFDLLDNEFLLIKEENDSYSSPIASLGYSYYDDINDVAKQIKIDADKLQCVVAQGEIAKTIKATLGDLTAPAVVDFGTTQCPMLNDYADGVDTVNFLLTLS
ncbi:acyl-CoA reductase [Nonlabens arenilitoris]|uniref:Acyl-CoA reductase n=1 Tax=Nonlabens arenilitoris TaxID=1217969 RepID=A0A2S7UE95_9FLAO|nr:acyl-CoA reductase [Nonlabens arenilitoris]PQJ32911.1 acyl-CoA reductase [Nonlabens arenilitoris]